MRFVLALLLLAVGCRSLPGPTPNSLPPDEAVWVAKIEAAPPDTTQLIESFASEHPRSVDAARYRQILKIARGEAWQAHEAARSAWEADPDDADLLYLYARTVPDREVQRDLFRQAVDLDPSHFHANLGLAVVSLALRDIEEAGFWAQRAFLIRIDSVRANLVYARALAAGGHRDEAYAILESLLKDDPANASAASAFVDLTLQEGREVEAMERIVHCLEHGGFDARLAGRARRLVSAGVATDRDLRALEAIIVDEPSAWRLRVELLLARGQGFMALMLLVGEVEKQGLDPIVVRHERIRAALLAGTLEWGVACAAHEQGLVALKSVSGEDRRQEVVGALHDVILGPWLDRANRHAVVARLLSMNGFAAEATLLANRAVSLDPANEIFQTLAADLAAWQRFLTDVRDAVRRSYWREKTRQPRVDLDDFLAGLAKASKRHLGRDIVSGIPVDDWPFVGSVARTDFEGAPKDWADHGVFFVIGQRNGGPVQGTMMRIAAHFPDQEVEGVPYELLVGDGRLFRTYFEFDGGDIAGFAMPGRVVLDLESLTSSEAALRRIGKAAADRPLWPAPDEARRRSLWFPNGVRERLVAQYIAEGGTGAAFETALRHEEGHVLDGDRYTPISHHVPAIFYQALLHGFSPSSIEVTLEEHAEANSLLTSAHPRAALFGTASFLPGKRSGPPHSIAYYDLLTAIVTEIDEHPTRYPSIDRDYNILQQLDRLTDDELRSAIDEALD